MTADLPPSSVLVDPAERVVELLAIKLFENDGDSDAVRRGWLLLSEGDRDIFRKMARGEVPLRAMNFTPDDDREPSGCLWTIIGLVALVVLIVAAITRGPT